MHILILLHPAQVRDAVAVAGGALELQGGAGGLHLGLELVEHRGALAFQEHHRQTHVVGVAGAVDAAHAGGAATLDLVLQAGPRTVLEEAVRTGAHAKQLLQDVQAVAHRGGAGERAEETPRPLGAAMEGQARIRVLGEVDVGVGLVVAQQDVEARTFRLDEALFEQQRLGFAAGDGHLDVARAAGEGERLRRKAGGAVIGRHPRLEVARLAHIEHFAAIAHKAIDARPRWQRGEKAVEAGVRVDATLRRRRRHACAQEASGAGAAESRCRCCAHRFRAPAPGRPSRSCPAGTAASRTRRRRLRPALA